MISPRYLFDSSWPGSWYGPSQVFQVRMVNGHSFLDIHTGAFCGASPECCGCLYVHFQRQRANADLLYVTRNTHFIKHWYIIPGGPFCLILAPLCSFYYLPFYRA